MSATCELQNTIDPQAAPAFNAISAITGMLATDVWIGGTGKQPFGQAGTLIEHFNGTRWSIVPTPIERGAVLGMSAIAPDDVWAVGNDNRSGITSLAMHWDGVTWTQIPVVVKGCTQVFRLHEIDASGRRPVAVGQCFDDSGDVISVVISYGKRGWRPEKIAGIDPTTFQLTSINWTGRTAWAGGSTTPGQAVALRLHRHVWTSVPTPDNAFVLAGVAGTPRDSWGVGSGWQNVVLTMHWDGEPGRTSPTSSPAALRPWSSRRAAHRGGSGPTATCQSSSATTGRSDSNRGSAAASDHLQRRGILAVPDPAMLGRLPRPSPSVSATRRRRRKIIEVSMRTRLIRSGLVLALGAAGLAVTLAPSQASSAEHRPGAVRAEGRRDPAGLLLQERDPRVACG